MESKLGSTAPVSTTLGSPITQKEMIVTRCLLFDFIVRLFVMRSGSDERRCIVPRKVRILIVPAYVTVVPHNKVLKLRIFNVEFAAALKEVLSVKGLKCINCIVLYFRLFPNMGDKTHAFAINETYMQRVRIETQIEIRNNTNRA